MKKQEKKALLILIVVAALIIGIIWVATRGNKDEEVSGGTAGGQEEIVKVEADGTKVNPSEKLNKDKKTDEFEISNISFTEKNGETILKARITNRTKSAQDSFFGKIVLLDKEGKTMGNIPILVSATQSGEAIDVETTINTSYVDAYDFKLER